MKNLIIVCFVINCFGAFSQDKLKDNLSDYLTFEITNLSIIEHIESKKVTSEEDIDYYNSSIKPLADSNTLKNPISFEKLMIKLQYEEHWVKVSEKITNKFHTWIVSEIEKGATEVEIYNGLNDIKWEEASSTKNLLKKVVTENIDEMERAISGAFHEDGALVHESTNGEDDAYIETSEKAVSFFSYSFNILHVFFIVLIFILVLILAKRKCPQKEELEKKLSHYHIKEMNHNKPNQSLSDSNGSKISSLENKIENLNKELKTKDEAIAKLKENSNAKKQERSIVSESPNVMSAGVKLFFPGPRPSGDFNVKHQSTIPKNSISLYRFELDSKDAFKAKVYFDTDSSGLNRALASTESLVTPVCQEMNAYNASATRIVNIKHGMAYLEGDKWIVRREDRIQIEYK